METKVLLLVPFFKDPNTLFHIREVAKATKLSHTAVGKHLRQFEKECLVIKKQTTPYETYKANTDSIAFRNLKRYYNLEQLRITGLVSALEKEYEFPTLVLFGSYAQALDDNQSDIDICVISEVVKELSFETYEKKLQRKISIHHFTKKKWEETKKLNPELINSICNGFVLSGQLEVL